VTISYEFDDETPVETVVPVTADPDPVPAALAAVVAEVDRQVAALGAEHALALVERVAAYCTPPGQLTAAARAMSAAARGLAAEFGVRAAVGLTVTVRPGGASVAEYSAFVCPPGDPLFAGACGFGVTPAAAAAQAAATHRQAEAGEVERLRDRAAARGLRLVPAAGGAS